MATSAFTLRGSAVILRLATVVDRHCWRGTHGTYGTGLALVARLGPFGAVVTAAVGVAGVALGDIDLHFAWQAWHLVTSTVALRGRCGTW